MYYAPGFIIYFISKAVICLKTVWKFLQCLAVETESFSRSSDIFTEIGDSEQVCLKTNVFFGKVF